PVSSFPPTRPRRRPSWNSFCKIYTCARNAFWVRCARSWPLPTVAARGHGGDHDAVTPTLPSGPAAPQRPPAHPTDVPSARHPLRPPLRPLAGRARPRRDPDLSGVPAPGTARLRERLQPGRLCLTLLVRRDAASPVRRGIDPLRKEA